MIARFVTFLSRFILSCRTPYGQFGGTVHPVYSAGDTHEVTQHSTADIPRACVRQRMRHASTTSAEIGAEMPAVLAKAVS